MSTVELSKRLTRKRTSLLQGRWAILALIIALALPTSVIPVFQGVPFNTPLSAFAIGLAALGLIFVGRHHRALGVLAFAALFVKVVLILMPTTAGFSSCIVLGDSAQSTDCVRSFDEPLASGYTRSDYQVDYGSDGDIRGSDWEIGALNDSTFDFYRDDQPERFRPTLRATWRGESRDLPNSQLTYIGEGEVRLPDGTVTLPPAYEVPGVITIPSSASDQFELDFAWISERGGGSFAQIQWFSASGEPINPIPPAMAEMVVSFVAAVLLAVSLVILAFTLLRQIGPVPRAWFAVAILMVIAGISLLRPSPSPTVPLIAPILVGLLMYCRAICSTRKTWLLFFLTTPLIAYGLAAGQVGSLRNSVVYRGGGTDFLYYESQGRALLAEGNLRGGEDVFVYSPAMRYVNFLLHLVFGDGHTLPIASMILLTLAGLWFAIDRLVVRPLRANDAWSLKGLRSHGVPWGLLVVFTPMVTSIFLWSAEVNSGPFIGLSEYPTWILLLFAIPLALTTSSLGGIATTSVLLGLDFAFRANHSVGLAVIGLALLLRIYRGPGRAKTGYLLAATAPGVAIALLPALHNWVYGEVMQLLPASVSSGGVNNPLSLSSVPGVFTDPVTQELFVGQLGGVFAIPTLFPPPGGELSILFTLSVRAIQLGLVLALGLGVWHRFRGPWRSSMLVAIPAAFLLPHLILVVYFYYPRHIVAGYLAGSLVLMAMATRHFPSRIPQSSRDVRAIS